jgi:spore maturation protein CgeB
MSVLLSFVSPRYEVLACGTFLITPVLAEYHSFDNLQAHFYLPNRPDQLAESNRFCLQYEEERNEAARACCEQVHQLHRLELRCETLVAALKGQLCTR